MKLHRILKYGKKDPASIEITGITFIEYEVIEVHIHKLKTVMQLKGNSFNTNFRNFGFQILANRKGLRSSITQRKSLAFTFNRNTTEDELSNVVGIGAGIMSTCTLVLKENLSNSNKNQNFYSKFSTMFQKLVTDLQNLKASNVIICGEREKVINNLLNQLLHLRPNTKTIMVEFIEQEDTTNLFAEFPQDDFDNVNYSEDEPLDKKFFHSDHLLLFDANSWFVT